MPKTEDEARQLWCPHARVVEIADDQLHGPFNRYHSSEKNNTEARCIASDCMMWQPYYDPAPGEALAAIKRRRAETGCGLKEAKDWWDTLPQNGTRGDCGLKR